MFCALADPQPEAGELMPDTAGFVQRLVEEVEAFEARAVETELAGADAEQIARELVVLRRAGGRTSEELVPHRSAEAGARSSGAPIFCANWDGAR